MTEKEIEYKKALQGAAQLVKLYGDEFLPAFTRMEREIGALSEKSAAVARARAVVETMGL
ncbi:hypothetical protein GFB49_11500 [Epibacterium sp. SM1979]|uniref:Uncharacterized protein n=1 Tax=Tritonibacter litoralis TaxID=2662264 RepID=A0A843YDU0_9RHOB|nr:hypothetical protein [Tritonibacter litoralis]MQQ09081.1 hypothetical protein [Tritonibacter litoralis]